MHSQDRVFYELAHHPPQKLKDSSYFNYYNSTMTDFKYLNEKQNQQASMSRSTTNFKTLCDRNFINTSQYHKYQKFGNNQHQRDMIVRQQKQQEIEKMKKIEEFEKKNINEQKQQRLNQIKCKQQPIIDYKSISIYKKVIDCKKINKPVTLSFSRSIYVQIHDVLEDNDKVTKKIIKRFKSTFSELQNMLHCNTQQITTAIHNQIEQNIRQNDIDKPIDFNIRMEENISKYADDTYFVSYQKTRIRYLQKIYEVIITFPVITIFVVEESYKQKIRISRKWIQMLFENKFQECFNNYVHLFNVRKMKRESRNQQLKLQSKMSWDLTLFKKNTILLKTINNKVQEDIHEIEIIDQNVQRVEIEKEPQTISNQ